VTDSSYETILYEEDGPLGRITLNRPEHGNMFNATMLRELKDVLEGARQEIRTRALILTGAGDRFFCIGGDKDGLEETYAYPGVLPVLDVYELIDRHPKHLCIIFLGMDGSVMLEASLGKPRVNHNYPTAENQEGRDHLGRYQHERICERSRI